MEIMRSLASDLLQNETPAAIGVSFGGSVDATTGTVRLSHQVEGWENTGAVALASDILSG
ncbi:glucokinase [Microseira wollei NIES-4236]|uniref:Glucokinase n=2 Tax=Microseira wollei TaxID=467598 RepID=A0AAV3XT00_9CYAN|nr:glucokinase [Microseira wollei NIES-4236]